MEKLAKRIGEPVLTAATAWTALSSAASPPGTGSGGEANLVLPDLSTVSVMGGVSGRLLLGLGLVVCVLGLGFGMLAFVQLRRLPVHASMLEVSELIYSTCKAYLAQQGKFLMMLWAFIAAVIVVYYRFLIDFPWGRVAIVIAFSLLGMAGSYAVAWFGIRVNTFANSRTAFAALRGGPLPVHRIPLKSGMSIGMVLISLELLMMLVILLFLPREIAGACFIGFAIGESLGAAALRIAGGIFTKIADIGSDLMKIAFKIKEDDARNPGVIADCTGDNAGDSVGPSADGFETYGVTGVALITFVLLGVHDPRRPGHPPGLDVRPARGDDRRVGRVLPGQRRVVRRQLPGRDPDELRDPADLAGVDHVGRLRRRDLRDHLRWSSATVRPRRAGGSSRRSSPSARSPVPSSPSWSRRSRPPAAATSARSSMSSREGGPSLNILSGPRRRQLLRLLARGHHRRPHGRRVPAVRSGLSALMLAPAVFAFGLLAFGFLGMGPVTIAVDSYGPVTDNAQSVYELSMIEEIDGIETELAQDHGFAPQWDRAKTMLEENDGAGNTFKATAKPVLIGTAVVGATTMIFSIIMGLTDGLTTGLQNLSLLHPPFLLGLVMGGAVIFWFTGASIQAVTTGAYRAVEFIRTSIRLDGVTKASEADSRRVVEICTQYAQQGMLTMFLGVFFATLAFAFVEPYFFIGYLISIAIFGLYQAFFMANAGGAWDNAKKIVEIDLHAKGTALHEATIIGDTVGDPYKDTSSVALNPVIKFTTLFGLLAVQLSVQLVDDGKHTLVAWLAATFFLASLVFVYRSFYGMRIQSTLSDGDAPAEPKDDGDGTPDVVERSRRDDRRRPPPRRDDGG